MSKKTTFVLVVEDSPTTQIIVKKTIERMGFCVVTANDGVDALDKLQIHDNNFKLVVTDINMPRMNGFEFIESLQQNEVQKKIPVIVVSSETSEEKIAIGKSLNIKAWITKPIHPLKFIKELQEGDPELFMQKKN